MTWFEFAVTYAVCWWLVLFMVLPHQADAEANPATGHARSAPANPQLRKKFRWATLFAFIPAIALYFIVSAAQAETVYHVGNRCKPLTTHVPEEGITAHDGYGTGGKKVRPATIGDGSTLLGDQSHFDIPILIPAENYTNPSAHNVDLSQSFVGAGKLEINRDGTAKLNSQAIVPQDTYPEGCEEKK